MTIPIVFDENYSTSLAFFFTAWMHKQLEIWVRAQLEAARHPNSDRKYNFRDCRACENLKGQHPQSAEILSPEKRPVGWAKVHQIFNPRHGRGCRLAVDHLLSRFWLCRSAPELFAIEVESCQKSSGIFDVFTLTNFVVGTPCKISVHVVTLASSHVPWQSYRRAYVEF